MNKRVVRILLVIINIVLITALIHLNEMNS